MCASARQLKNKDYDQYDLLIGMDQPNFRNMHRICGGGPDGKIHLLTEFSDQPKAEVADPWYTGDFKQTWQDVLAGYRELPQAVKVGTGTGRVLYGEKKNEITIRPSAAEYLTFIASTGDSTESYEMRYEERMRISG